MESEIKQLIMSIREKVSQGRNRFTNGQGAESNVVDNIVRPLLRTLRWNIGTNLILREEDVKLRRKRGRADLVLSVGPDQYVLALEAKKLGEDVSGSSKKSTEHIDQLIDYLISLNLEFGILTDGEWWHLIRRSGYDWHTLWLKNLLKDNVESLIRVFVDIIPENALELSNRVDMERRKLDILTKEWEKIQKDHELQLKTLSDLLLNQTRIQYTEIQIEPIEIMEFLKERHGGLIPTERFVKRTDAYTVKGTQDEKEPEKLQKIQSHISENLSRPVRTQDSVFVQPILLALESLGGSASVKEIMNLVYKQLEDQLTPFDFELVANNEPRWRNSARWSASTIAKEGLLNQGPPRGIWHITSKGKKAIQ